MPMLPLLLFEIIHEKKTNAHARAQLQLHICSCLFVCFSAGSKSIRSIFYFMYLLFMYYLFAL